MYSFKSRVRYSELNHQTHTLDPYGIINYFQDCSTFQSEELNIGLEALQKIDRAWILNSWQLQILANITLGEDIIVSTWAYDFKRFYGYRNFLMTDENSQVLAVANSIWVYINTKSGRPERVPDDNLGYNLKPPYPMEYSPRKIKLPEKLVDYPCFPVVKANIDSYKHVNNSQYIRMAQEHLPHNFLSQKMRVEYRKQAKLGDTIIPQVFNNGDLYIIALSDLEYNPYAILEFQGFHTID